MTDPRENTGIPGPAPNDQAQPDSAQIVEPGFQSQQELQVNSTENSEAPITSADPATSPQTPPQASSQAYQAPVRHYHEPQGLQFYLSVLVIVLYMTTFVVQAIRIPSESMENTLMVGDFLLADKIHYSAEGWLGRHFLPYRGIRRGDIVVFHFPVDPKQYFVKRVVGLPGDHIKLLDKTVLVNGERLREDYVRHVLHDYNPYRDSFPDVTFLVPPYLTTDVDRQWRKQLFRYLDHGEIVVPAGNYFVMGDNRDRSLDSRYWGFVPRGNITGRPLVIYLSVNQPDETEPAAPNDKLIHSGQILAHIMQFARWDRMFRPVH
jgi:signal peptidase I